MSGYLYKYWLFYTIELLIVLFNGYFKHLSGYILQLVIISQFIVIYTFECLIFSLNSYFFTNTGYFSQ